MVSEEDVADNSIPNTHASFTSDAQSPTNFWLVDPLDGTNGFVRGSHEYVSMLAFIENGEAKWGMICHPPSGRIIWGDAELRMIWHTTLAPPQADKKAEIAAAFREPTLYPSAILWAPETEEGAGMPTISVNSRLRRFAHQGYISTRESDANVKKYCQLHGQEHYKHGGFTPMNSGLKFMHMALGYGTFYFRSFPCSEWDVAAGAALVHAMGGSVRTHDHQPLRFGVGRDFLCGTGFAAIAPSLATTPAT